MDVQEQAPRPPLTGEDNGVDDDPPTLSPYALEALKAFLAEQNAIGGATTSSLEEEEKEEKVRLLSEDWRLSQFWYAPETAETVAKEVLYLCSNEVAESTAAVACIACPTLFAYLKKLDPHASMQLLEYDKRFEEYGSDFTFYDYNLPEDLPQSMKHAFQILVADPPYLSGECLEKVAQTIAFLAQPGKCFLLLLTVFLQVKCRGIRLQSY